MEAEVNVVQALKAHVVQLEQAVQAADEKTAVLKSTNEDLQMKMTVDLKDAQAATVGAEAAGQVASSALAEMKLQCQALEAQLDKKEAELVEQRGSWKRIEIAFNEAKKEATRAQKSLQNSEKELKKVREELEAKVEHIAAKESEVTTLTSQVKRLPGLEEQNVQLMAQLQNMQQNDAKHTNQLQEMQQNNDLAQKEISKHVAQLLDAQQRHAKCQEESKGLQKENLKLAAQLQDMEQNHADLANQLQESQQNHDQALNEIAKHLAQLHDVQQIHAKCQEEFKAAEDCAARNDQRANAAERRNQALIERVAKLEADNKQGMSAIQIQEQEAQGKLKEMIAEKLDLSNKFDELQARMAVLQDRATEADANTERLQTTIQTLEAEKMEAVHQVAKLEEENAKAINAMRTQERDAQGKLKEAVDAKTDLSNKLDELQACMAVLQEKSTEADANAVRLHTAIQTLEAEKMEAVHQTTKLEEENAKAINAIQTQDRDAQAKLKETIEATSALLRRSQKDFHAAVCDRERYKQVVVQLLAGSGRMLEEFDLDRGAETLQEERRTQLSSLTQDRDFYHDECKRMQAKERKVTDMLSTVMRSQVEGMLMTHHVDQAVEELTSVIALEREKAQALLKARTRSTTGVKETSFGDVPEQASVEQASVAETTLMAKRASEHGSVAEEASVLDDNESEDSFLAEHQHREPMTPDENDEAQRSSRKRRACSGSNSQKKARCSDKPSPYLHSPERAPLSPLPAQNCLFLTPPSGIKTAEPSSSAKKSAAKQKSAAKARRETLVLRTLR
jgi:chromosome segregation ATPase